jgi:phosphonopyruvate decarboxylase
VALAIGHYLATGRPALVYMQNSGLGNTINPLASLADPAVYAVPVVLMIGWRGEVLPDGRQLADEPQHVAQGRVTLEQLDLLGIPYEVIDQNTGDEVQAVVETLARRAVTRSGPVALVVRKNTFAPFSTTAAAQDATWLTREAAIAAILGALPKDMPVIGTTGMASRELFELRTAAGDGHARDFLTVGGMGHAGQIAAGIAMAMPDSRIACIDGDGAVLMHMGALAISADCPNLIHLVINNEAHDSVGGQPTKGQMVDFAAIARECGYGTAVTVSAANEIAEAVERALASSASALIVVRCRRGARPDLGRPDRSPVDNKRDFMGFLGSA